MTRPHPMRAVEIRRRVNREIAETVPPLMRMVEEFLIKTGMAPEEFSRRVGERATLVRQMRDGRAPGPQLEANIRLLCASSGVKQLRADIIAPSQQSLAERDELLNGFLRAEARRLQVPLIDLLVAITRTGAERHAEERGLEL
jgi:hypothetical protein